MRLRIRWKVLKALHKLSSTANAFNDSKTRLKNKLAKVSVYLYAKRLHKGKVYIGPLSDLLMHLIGWDSLAKSEGLST